MAEGKTFRVDYIGRSLGEGRSPSFRQRLMRDTIGGILSFFGPHALRPITKAPFMCGNPVVLWVERRRDPLRGARRIVYLISLCRNEWIRPLLIGWVWATGDENEKN